MQFALVSMIKMLPFIIAAFGILFLLWFLYNLCVEGGYCRCRKKSNYPMDSTKSDYRNKSLGLMIMLMSCAAMCGQG